MAIGDQADIVSRLRAVLPASWFPQAGPGQASTSPVLDAALAGIAWPLAGLYALVQYAIVQSRVATCTDVWLDLVSRDFFGRRLPRRAGEPDAAFRGRIGLRLFRPAATRAAVVLGLERLTGRVPRVIEPWSTGDCGTYGGAGADPAGTAAYGVAGCYGSLTLPHQMFVQAYRPGTAVPGTAPGQGYAGTDVDPGAAAGQVTDADIYAIVADLMPAGTIGWTNIGS